MPFPFQPSGQGQLPPAMPSPKTKSNPKHSRRVDSNPLKGLIDAIKAKQVPHAANQIAMGGGPVQERPIK